MRQNKCAVVGLSPRNPYYKEPANIEFAIAAAAEICGRVTVFVPGLLDRYNFLAYGESEERALAKARDTEAALRDVICEVCSSMRREVPVLTCSDYFAAPAYQCALANTEALYEENAGFREDVRNAVACSLNSHLRVNSRDRRRVERKGIDQATETAKDYLLGELAFLQASLEMLNAEEVTYFYHQNWPVFEKLIAGNYDACARRGLSFRAVNRADGPR